MFDLSLFDLSSCRESEILEIGGELYSLEIKKLHLCHKCGQPMHLENRYDHRAKIYKGKSFHLPCLREMYSKSSIEKFSEYQRIGRILKRISRNQLLTGPVISRICSSVAPRLRKRSDSILPHHWWLGMFKGGPVLPGELKQYEAMDFWEKAEKKSKRDGDIELAALLLISGDRNAINHATSRSSGNLWRGKAVNSGNHRQH